MGDVNAAELIRLSDHLFSKKLPLDSLHQAIAEEIYPERADFTITRSEGIEYADMLVTSYPAQTRRDLASAMGALTRPKSEQWFRANVREDLRTDHAKWWLNRVTDQQRALLYTPDAGFQRAMQTSDDDVCAFGNAIVSHVESPRRNGLCIYDVYHPKNCAWTEDDHRMVNVVHRKFMLKLCNWEQRFPKTKLPEKYVDLRKRDPYHQVWILHVVMPHDHYDAYNKARVGKHPYSSVYIDKETQTVIAEGGYYEFPYTVRRWKLNDQSQYAYSPAATLGLVEARLLQSQTKVVLDAGERAVDPPMIATRDAVLGNIGTYAGAVTWVDGDYDERLGQAIRPVDSGANIPLGLDFIQDTRSVLMAAQYISKLTLPSDKEMTAFEVNERISEYIRSIGPVVEPFQDDNSMILGASFSVNLRLGQFGPKSAIPREIAGADIIYDFEGPLQAAYQRIKMGQAKETFENAMIMAERMAAIQYPGAHIPLDNLDLNRMTRDSATYSYGDDWLKALEEVSAKQQADQEAMAAAAAQQSQGQEIANASAVADIVPKMDAANQSINNISADNDTGEDDEEVYPNVGDEVDDDDEPQQIAV